MTSATAAARNPAAPQWISTTEARPWVQMPINPRQAGATAAITVSPQQAQQTVDGFGGCFNELGYDALMKLPRERAEQIITDLFSDRGCAFNIARMPIGASDFARDYYSLDDTPGDLALAHFSLARDEQALIPYIRAALVVRPKLKVWGSPWTPPAWMKDNNRYNGGHLRWEPAILSAYAKYLALYVQQYRRHSIPVYAVHVQNEPYADQPFPSCLWTGEQMRDFIRDYLGPTFKKEKLDAEIWLGTINNDNFQACAGTVLADPQAAALITGVGYQWAGKGAIAQTHSAYPKKKLMQTETECGDGSNNWAAADHTFHLMLDYFNNGANAYMYWNMVLDERAVSSWGWKQNSMVTIDRRTGAVTYHPEFYVMEHFSHFIQPGAKLIASAGWSNDRIAFLNPDGRIVVILGNAGAATRVSIAVEGAGPAVTVTLPAQSFNTIVLPQP